MALLNKRPVSSNVFSYSERTKVLFAEVSSLPENPWVPLYDDACDVGVVVKSEKTGAYEAFALCEDETIRSNENEILGWRLYPCNPRLKAAGVKMTIIND